MPESTMTGARTRRWMWPALLLLLTGLVAGCAQGGPTPEISEPTATEQERAAQSTATTVSPTEASQTELPPVEAWQQIVSLMTEAHDLVGDDSGDEAVANIEEARRLYEMVFQAEAQPLTPATDEFITTAFDDALAAAEAGDAVQVNLDRQRVDKGIYKIAFEVLNEELAEGAVEESEPWFAILAEKFGLYQDGEPTGSAVLFQELTRKPEELDRLRPQILEELRSTFLLKVEEEVAETIEALERDDTATAAEKAVEGLVYYLPIQPAVSTALGEEQAEQLYHALEELVEYAKEGDLEEGQHEADEITSMLNSYKSATLGGGIAVVAQDLSGLFKLIDEEYDAAVADGEIVDQVEYDETELFLSRAQETLENNREAIEESEAGLADDLGAALDEIEAIFEEKGDPARVTELVNASIEQLSGLAAAAGPSVAELELTSPAAAPGETVTLELKAEGVPDSPGLGAYDVTVTYDPALLTLDETSFAYGNGVVDEQEGQVRLAGFKAQDAAGGEVVLAELSFTVAEDASDDIEVTLAVNELADVEGTALSVTEVANGIITVSTGEAVSIDEVAVQDLIGTLKLVAEEYPAAVEDDEVIDEGEYEESRVFIQSAEDKFTEIRSQVIQAAPDAGPEILENIEDANALIGEQGSVDEVLSLVQASIDGLSQFVTSDIDPRVAGVADAVQIADAEITENGGEKIVGDYRIGVIVEAAEPFTIVDNGELTRLEPADETHHLEVVLRDVNTKRPLPDAGITITILDADGNAVAERQAYQLWAEFQHYANNFTLEPGEYTMRVDVTPPAVGRHADLSHRLVAPAQTEFPLTVGDDGTIFEAPAVTPLETSFQPGDDVLLALSEARELVETEQYRVGFIAEAPEPLWYWQDGAPVEQPISEDANHHLEIALFDKESNRVIIDAPVSVTLTNVDTDETISFESRPLLSEFFHYGANVAVPAGEYTVTADIGVPDVGRHSEGVFDEPETAEFTQTFSLGSE